MQFLVGLRLLIAASRLFMTYSVCELKGVRHGLPQTAVAGSRTEALAMRPRHAAKTKTAEPREALAPECLRLDPEILKHKDKDYPL